MRQTLFRLSLHDPWALWTTDAATGLPLLGVCILLAILAVGWTFGQWWFDGRKWSRPLTQSALGWVAAIGVLSLPAVATRIPVASVPVFGYGFMLLLGFLSALGFARRQARLAGIDPELMHEMGYWLLIPGVIGGRLAYLVQHGDGVFFDHAGQPLSGAAMLFAAVNLSNGGLVLIGAMVGGAVGYFAFCHRRRLPALALADVIVPSIFIGIAFGRLGCLLNGCCFGDACSLPWGITFPNGSVPFEVLAERGFVDPRAAATMPLHPTQIYMSIDGVLLAIITALYFRVRTRPGDVLALGCILCAITRILVEFLRNDEMGQLGTRFTISQYYSLGILAAGIGIAIYLRTSRTPASAQPDPALRPAST
ncbi:MAG: prolipoprotein diacylglyceryl transferase [Planctomycetaceae bacterium]|nr:prolipoprotein diacylglyceryl transferase [Planctomycetaceae bacterium]